MNPVRISGGHRHDLAIRQLAIRAVSMTALLSAAACGGPDPADGGAVAADAASSNEPDAAPPHSGTSSPDSTPEPAPVSIRGFTHRPDGSVLPGVNVCLERGSGVIASPFVCALSAADGSFVLPGADASSSATLTFRKDGFTPTLRALMTRTADITLPANENTLFPDPLTFLGTPADPTKGQIAFSAATAGGDAAQPVSVTATALDILTGFGSSLTPVYLDGNGAPVPDATSGTAGGFVNLPPGFYFLQFQYTAASCVPTSGIYDDSSVIAGRDPTPGLTGVAIPVREGFVSAPVGMSCVAKP